jgi:hypothetical protein
LIYTFTISNYDLNYKGYGKGIFNPKAHGRKGAPDSESGFLLCGSIHLSFLLFRMADRGARRVAGLGGYLRLSSESRYDPGTGFRGSTPCGGQSPQRRLFRAL